MGMTWICGLERLVESCQADKTRGYLVGEKGVWDGLEQGVWQVERPCVTPDESEQL